MDGVVVRGLWFPFSLVLSLELSYGSVCVELECRIDCRIV